MPTGWCIHQLWGIHDAKNANVISSGAWLPRDYYLFLPVIATCEQEHSSSKKLHTTITFNVITFFIFCSLLFRVVTHYCDKNRKGWFKVGRKTNQKKFRMKCKEMNNWLMKIRNYKKAKEWWPAFINRTTINSPLKSSDLSDQDFHWPSRNTCCQPLHPVRQALYRCPSCCQGRIYQRRMSCRRASLP